MPRPSFDSVEAYLAALPDDSRAVLGRVFAALRKGVPGAEPVISYGIPALRAGGRVVVYCAAFTAHYSVYPATRDLVEALGDALEPYEYNGKGTIRFPLAGKVPVALLTRIGRLRAAEDAARGVRRLAAKKK
ncbi:hypothetical protein TBR22_A40000 [Luteitalea sp. TBR-22]|uniref:iron chaperone n=1 Tax=Luteitalea sp. TBR-22 TaxID=2802971 RepID=UPI001AFB0294|nr:DUF1801 domain-containing protein [Luteitalea sp. TBR-22]BCS34774.1 hypothetical protein TBR22_A40000 [Luteitalea sp. TBR-22]